MSLINKKYSVVLRFKGLYPHQLARIRMHGNRSGGDLSHIDVEQTKKNEILIGPDTWMEDLKAEIAQVAARNLKDIVAARKTRQRPTEAAALKKRGPTDPWARSKEGPLREGILSANAKWFGGSGAAKWDPDKVSSFRDLAVRFLKGQFGEACVHARIDMDEEAVHIHFVVAPWTVKQSASRGIQRLLQPSSNPLFASYEYAQTVAGNYFSGLGLTRGAPHAKIRREAKAENLPLPEPVSHVPPTRWRLQQKARLKQVYLALQAQQIDLAEQQSRLARDREDLATQQQKLTDVWQMQIDVSQQAQARENQVMSDVKLLAASWQQAGLEVPPDLNDMIQRYF
ncbi:MAG: plasmid recombination protein [Pseudotabrizicola sp.]|uniref:plasmid recombination protein n=1 Tax=Pseudotabrizicola sp. TaxID=2939647 RepID=UPI0027243F67|nr:plasmid recombination protein [Pseudotabrizicola sp.]MDO9640891.1 plasmid recombination protein [Pseudotabrizicola sp.]